MTALPIPTGGRTSLPAWPAALLRSWRYAGGTRDLRLDLLRGFAAFAMVVDHIGGAHSWLYPLTGGNRFFVSAAEVFVLIAGLTMGMVYSSIIARQGIAAAVRKALRRSWSLYLLTLALTFSFAALSALLRLSWAPRLTADAVPGWAWEVLTLHRTYYLVDIPLLYALLIVAAAPLLVAMALGQTRWVLAGSLALWALWQVAPQAAHLPWKIADNTVFNIAAWQLLFVGGLAAGFHRRALERRLTGLSPWAVLAVTGALTAGAVALMLSQSRPGGLLAEGSALAEQLYGKVDVRLGRVLMLVVLFTFVYSLATLLWTPLERALGWLLMPLGRNSLTAYTLHLFAVALLAATLPTWTVLRGGGENALIQAFGVLLIWSIILLRPVVVARLRSALRRARAVARGIAEALQPRPGAARTPALVPIPVPAGRPLARPLLRSAVGALGLASVALLFQSGAVLWCPTTDASTAIPAATETAGAALSLARVETGTIESTLAGRSLPYLAFLPPGYDADARARYPVLYMLHGMGGSHTEWTEYGIFEEAERLMRSGAIPPMLIVLPEGGQSYWMDHAEGGPRWGAYVADELVAAIDARYRTLADRGHRALGGNSMGAHGALQLAMNFSETFGVAGAHSLTARGRDTMPAYAGSAAHFAAHDPVTLMQRYPDVARTLRLWLDIGDADYWTGAVTAFHTRLLGLGIPHEFHVFPGPHDDEYWRANVATYLTYYGAAMAD